MVYKKVIFLDFDRWNFQAGGWEGVPCTAIELTD
jgi:hypothetical protein